MDSAEGHNPLAGGSCVWVIFVFPAPGWTYGSLRVLIPCQVIQEGFTEEGDLRLSFKDWKDLEFKAERMVLIISKNHGYHLPNIYYVY